jgi:hypothetical protein
MICLDPYERSFPYVNMTCNPLNRHVFTFLEFPLSKICPSITGDIFLHSFSFLLLVLFHFQWFDFLSTSTLHWLICGHYTFLSMPPFFQRILVPITLPTLTFTSRSTRIVKKIACKLHSIDSHITMSSTYSGLALWYSRILSFWWWCYSIIIIISIISSTILNNTKIKHSLS